MSPVLLNLQAKSGGSNAACIQPCLEAVRWHGQVTNGRISTPHRQCSTTLQGRQEPVEGAQHPPEAQALGAGRVGAVVTLKLGDGRRLIYHVAAKAAAAALL